MAPLENTSTQYNIHGKIFKAASNSLNGEVNNSTRFEYRQKGKIVWATYEGGDILFGTLSGKISGNQLEFLYQHQNLEGKFKTGKCKSHIEIKEGKYWLYEVWQWTCDDYSEGTSLLEETILNS